MKESEMRSEVGCETLPSLAFLAAALGRYAHVQYQGTAPMHDDIQAHRPPPASQQASAGKGVTSASDESNPFKLLAEQMPPVQTTIVLEVL
jgi:hypothetical protein